MSQSHVLLVEDRESTRRMVEETLRRRGFDVSSTGTAEEARELLGAERAPDFLLTDLQLPDGSGLDLLQLGLERDPHLPAIVMSAFGTIEIAVEAVKRGAYDFVPKPFDTNRLVQLVSLAMERRPRAADATGEWEPTEEPGDGGIVGESEPIRKAVRQVRRVASSDATVLLLGESGTGKEVFARAIHDWSGRKDGPLTVVNCAAIPGELMEAEFFGSERGAFTGATARKLGKIEIASGGTLFLDEIGELPPGLQAKLLRVLQERTFMRVGGTEELRADIRVIAATNRDLRAQVESGHFRDDLYYRLAVFPVTVPSLGERREDIPALATIFAAEEATKHGRSLSLESEAIEKLERAAWPGNVRQLRNAVERAAILADGDVIRAEDFDDLEPPLEPIGSLDGGTATAGDEPVSLLAIGREAQREAETRAILAALAATGGNRKQAAARLGVSYKTLWSKVKEYEIEWEDVR